MYSSICELEIPLLKIAYYLLINLLIFNALEIPFLKISVQKKCVCVWERVKKDNSGSLVNFTKDYKEWAR